VICTRLPLNISDLLSSTLPLLGSYQLSGLESLDQVLKRFSSGTIEGPFILGIILTGILIPAFHYALWNGEPIWGLPGETAVGGVGGAVCTLSFLCSALVLWFLYSEIEHLPFVIVKKGRLWSICITVFGCAVAMTLCVITMFVRKHKLQGGR
jgi:hypothetical protein